MEEITFKRSSHKKIIFETPNSSIDHYSLSAVSVCKVELFESDRIPRVEGRTVLSLTDGGPHVNSICSSQGLHQALKHPPKSHKSQSPNGEIHQRAAQYHFLL